MPVYFKYLFSVLFILVFYSEGNTQGFLHTDGKNIVDENNKNVILRGIGTGNWMLMEGYMMKTEGIAGTQHEFREKLIETIGEQKTDEFFNAWLNNHLTQTDVDSLKSWGFNSLRVAMHYKWFTLPVEDEPVKGKNTWVLKGFKIIDNLLNWCSQNKMYLILDMHGAPGGQGKNADISDYDPSKPSLWESEENKAKTVALWRMLASRYSNEKWIGGYDLINETNWTFPENNNSQLYDLMVRITNAIREVDTNHIVFIEGNSFANDHSGLTPPWDDNLVYSFHKYSSGTTPSDLDWIIKLRDQFNVPLWMGESGENSNTWYTDFVTSLENNNIGWSWWPVKKNSINNVLNVPINKDYEDLINYWRGEIANPPGQTKAFNAVMQWANNHKIQNCTVQYDVIDALIRQPHSNKTKPYKLLKTGKPIFFSDFDFGKNGFAYFDTDVAYYGGTWTAWNTGWGLRNDGVDIEVCTDTNDTTNGYNVGWTESGEWMQYTAQSDSTALYQLKIRHASGGSGSSFKIEVNNSDVTGELHLPATGGWQKWNTSTFENILIPAGKIRIKFKNTTGGSNLSYLSFIHPKSAQSIDFKVLSARTSKSGSSIFVAFNKEITSPASELKTLDFSLSINGKPITIDSIGIYSESSNEIILTHAASLSSDQDIRLSYNGESIRSKNQLLQNFSDLAVTNNLPLTHQIPGFIEAEAFEVNNGLSLENCSDTNGGQNTSYAAEGEYLDYRVHVSKTGFYALNYRVATQQNNAEVIFLVGNGTTFSAVDTFTFSATGGWQNWQTQTSQNIRLEEGYYFVRIFIKQGEHNLNWFSFDLLTPNSSLQKPEGIRIYPNPVHSTLTVQLPEYGANNHYLEIIDTKGTVLISQNKLSAGINSIDVTPLPSGYYIVKIQTKTSIQAQKFVKQ